MVILPMRTAKTNNHPKLNYNEKQTSEQILHWENKIAKWYSMIRSIFLWLQKVAFTLECQVFALTEVFLLEGCFIMRGVKLLSGVVLLLGVNMDLSGKQLPPKMEN